MAQPASLQEPICRSNICSYWRALSIQAKSSRQRQSTSLCASKQSTWRARNSLGFVIRRQVERTYLSEYRRTFWIDVKPYSKHATLVSGRRRQSFNMNTQPGKTMNCTEKNTAIKFIYYVKHFYEKKNIIFILFIKFGNVNPFLDARKFILHSLPNYEYLVPNDCSLLCAYDFKWDDFFSPWLWAQHFFSFSWAVIIKASPIASFPFVAPVAYDFQLPLEGIWHMILVLRAVNSSP